MKKPGWVSFCGWFTVAVLLFIITAAVLAAVSVRPPIPAHTSAMAFLLAIPSFGLWLVGTVVYKWRASGAQMQAAAMMQAQERMLGRGAARKATPPAMGPARVGEMTVARCGVCGSAPVSDYCKTHGVFICERCAPLHSLPVAKCEVVHARDMSGAGAGSAAGS